MKGEIVSERSIASSGSWESCSTLEAEGRLATSTKELTKFVCTSRKIDVHK